MDEQHFSVEEDIPIFIESVLEKCAKTAEGTSSMDELQATCDLIDETVDLLNNLEPNSSAHERDYQGLVRSLEDVMFSLQNCIAKNLFKFSVGRPSIDIPASLLEDLLSYNFTIVKIAKMLGVSRCTIHRRMKDFGLDNSTKYNAISDLELDNKIKHFYLRNGSSCGQIYVMGYLTSIGLKIQRARVRKSMNRIDPENTALRWGAVVSRRIYSVPWPNSLWHIDGHHSLIRWKLVIHGCIDGFSRRVMFLKCSNNNLSTTVLELFMGAIQGDGGLYPSRIRVDRGVENVLICDEMVRKRGENRGSFIAGPSTHNQRIERLWREVYRCVCYVFYYTFYAMESAGLLDVTNELHLLVLHTIFIPRINFSLVEFMEAYNNHALRTEHNKTPNQLWIEGMGDIDNPLALNDIDDTPQDLTTYGYGQQNTRFGDSNNVVVEDLNVSESEDIKTQILRCINPLSNSSNFGIDIYSAALNIVS